MMRIRRLALGGAAALASAALALQPRTALEIENAARRTVVPFAIGPGEPFAVTSWHSIYDQPVTEEFALDERGGIDLRAVSSPSAAVREYFGIDGPGERHAVARAMSRIVFRVAAGSPQRLLLRGREVSFLELGDHGDRLVMRAVRRPAAILLLASLLHAAPQD